jgi:hypothetical protein
MNDYQKNQYLEKKVAEAKKRKIIKKKFIEKLTPFSKIGIISKKHLKYVGANAYTLSTGHVIYDEQIESLRFFVNKFKIKNDEILKILLNIDINVDKVDQITFLMHKELNNKNTIRPYISIQDKKISLRIKTGYYSSNWLFVHSYKIAIDDKRIKKVDKFKRDILYAGNIIEWTDKVAFTEDIQLIENIVNSKETIIKFYGKKYYDSKTISVYEKRLIRDTLFLYKYLISMNK